MLEEENAYFRGIVKDAVEDLETKGNTYVFFQEQVDAVKQKINKEVKVRYDGNFYKIVLIKERK